MGTDLLLFFFFCSRILFYLLDLLNICRVSSAISSITLLNLRVNFFMRRYWNTSLHVYFGLCEGFSATKRCYRRLSEVSRAFSLNWSVTSLLGIVKANNKVLITTISLLTYCVKWSFFFFHIYTYITNRGYSPFFLNYMTLRTINESHSDFIVFVFFEAVCYTVTKGQKPGVIGLQSVDLYCNFVFPIEQ